MLSCTAGLCERPPEVVMGQAVQLCSFQWGQNPNCCHPALQATCMSGRRMWSSRQRCSSAAMPTGARQSASGRTT